MGVPVILVVLFVLPEAFTPALIAVLSVIGTYEALHAIGMNHPRIALYTALVALAIPFWVYFGEPRQWGLLVLLVDMCTANNTVAIVMSGPVAKEIGDEFGVESKRVASILDIFASVGQGLLPYGAQLLTAAALTGITPLDAFPYLYYPILMLVSVLLFIAFRPQKSKLDGAPPQKNHKV